MKERRTYICGIHLDGNVGEGTLEGDMLVYMYSIYIKYPSLPYTDIESSQTPKKATFSFKSASVVKSSSSSFLIS